MGISVGIIVEKDRVVTRGIRVFARVMSLFFLSAVILLSVGCKKKTTATAPVKVLSQTQRRINKTQADKASKSGNIQNEDSNNAKTSAQVATSKGENTMTTANDASPRVLIETSMGDIELTLNREKAPLSVENFLKYTSEKFYDGTIFHRVIGTFMVQGGGFDEKMIKKDTHAAIQNEADNGLHNSKYTVAMARTSDPHSATAQFFINVVDNAFLDHKSKSGPAWGYAVFGEVTKGQDVVDKIKAVATTTKRGMGDVPVEPVTMKTVRVVE